MTIVVRTRSTAASRRCAWCHDAEGGASGSRCGGCRTWLHAACWSEAAEACPTRGCSRQRRRFVAEPRQRVPDWMFVAGTFLAMLVMGGLAVAKFRAALETANTGPLSLDSDITAKINGGGQ